MGLFIALPIKATAFWLLDSSPLDLNYIGLGLGINDSRIMNCTAGFNY